MDIGDIFLIIGIFTITWWTVIFAVLPFGAEPSKKLVKGQASSAPDKPRIKQKLLITTGISIVLTTCFYIWMRLDQ